MHIAMAFPRARWALAGACVGWLHSACTPPTAPPTDGTSGGSPGSGGTSVGPGVGGASGGSTAAGGDGSGGGDVAGGSGGGSSGGSVATGGTIGSDVVTLTESTYDFQHYPIEVDAGGVWNGATTPGST